MAKNLEAQVWYLNIEGQVWYLELVFASKSKL